MSILYLHGFASGPQSRKARFFADHLQQIGLQIQIPDLTEGDFERLTLSRQIKFIEGLIDDREVVLIGSSLGGYLAALCAARRQEIKRLVLLAPAFGFYQLWITALGPERLAQWRANGFLDVFHYAEGREVPLAYRFLDDSSRFEAFPRVSQPVLIFHGDRDPVVPVEQSLAFVGFNPQAKLVRFDQSEHELIDVLDTIWSEAENFLLEGALSSAKS